MEMVFRRSWSSEYAWTVPKLTVADIAVGSCVAIIINLPKTAHCRHKRFLFQHDPNHPTKQKIDCDRTQRRLLGFSINQPHLHTVVGLVLSRFDSHDFHPIILDSPPKFIALGQI